MAASESVADGLFFCLWKLINERVDMIIVHL